MNRLRIYLDTSVLGGCFDVEFEAGSIALMKCIQNRTVKALVSETLLTELANAPERVRTLLITILEGDAERLVRTEMVDELRDAYLDAKILSEKWSEDATHVAHATMGAADVIVSWNFKHLLNPTRMRGFSMVNATRGHKPVVIMTPADLVKFLEEQADEIGIEGI